MDELVYLVAAAVGILLLGAIVAVWRAYPRNASLATPLPVAQPAKVTNTYNPLAGFDSAALAQRLHERLPGGGVTGHSLQLLAADVTVRSALEEATKAAMDALAEVGFVDASFAGVSDLTEDEPCILCGYGYLRDRDTGHRLMLAACLLHKGSHRLSIELQVVYLPPGAPDRPEQLIENDAPQPVELGKLFELLGTPGLPPAEIEGLPAPERALRMKRQLLAPFAGLCAGSMSSQLNAFVEHVHATLTP